MGFAGRTALVAMAMLSWAAGARGEEADDGVTTPKAVIATAQAEHRIVAGHCRGVIVTADKVRLTPQASGYVVHVTSEDSVPCLGSMGRHDSLVTSDGKGGWSTVIPMGSHAITVEASPSGVGTVVVRSYMCRNANVWQGAAYVEDDWITCTDDVRRLAPFGDQRKVASMAGEKAAVP